MRCQVWKAITEPDAQGKRRWQCTTCGRTTNPTSHEPDQIFAKCRGPQPQPTTSALKLGLEFLRRWKPLPGDVLERTIYHATASQVAHGLGCQAFQRKMNRWGWLGCLKRDNRRAILKRLREQAAKEGYSFTHRAIALHLLKAAAHWLKSRLVSPSPTS